LIAQLEPTPAGSTRHTPAPATRVVRGALIILSTQPLTWAARLALTILIPSLLGDRGLGQYAVALTISALAGTIVSAGIPTYLVRRTATDPVRPDIAGTASLLLLTALGLVVSCVIVALKWLTDFPLATPLVLAIALGDMFTLTALTVLFAMLNGQERYARFAWLNAASVVIGPFLGVALLLAGQGVATYMAVNVATTGVVTIVGWYTSGYRLPLSGIRVPLIRELLRGGWPFFGWGMATKTYGEIDKILLGFLASQTVIGWYAAAYRIVSIPMFIPSVLLTPLLPALSACADDPVTFRRTLRPAIVLVVLVTLPIASAIVALAPLVPGFLGWPSAFQGSVLPMQILALNVPLVSLDMVLYAALVALHREGRWLRFAIGAALLNPGLNVVLIPLTISAFGNAAIGAAACTVVTELFMLTGALVLLPWGMIDRPTLGLTFRIALAAMALVVVATFLRPSLVMAGTAGVAAFVGAAFLLGIVSPRDLRGPRHVALRAALERWGG